MTATRTFLLTFLLTIAAVFCCPTLYADQPPQHRVLTESVTLISPSDDTTFYCPLTQIYLYWKATVPSTSLKTFHVQVTTDSTFTKVPMLIDDVIMGPGNQTASNSLPKFTTSQTLFWRATTNFTTDWSAVRRINVVFPCGIEDLNPPDNSKACMSTMISWTNPAKTRRVVFQAHIDSANGALMRLDSSNADIHSAYLSTQSGTRIIYWQVTVIDSTGKEITSTPRRLDLVFPDIVNLTEPMNHTTFVKDVDSIALLRWVGNPDARSYIVFVQGPSGYKYYDTLTNTNLPFHLKGLAEGDYSWRVRCMCDSIQGGSFCPALGFVISTSSDVTPQAHSTVGLDLQPNPFSQQLRILLPTISGTESMGCIYNSVGEVVYRMTSSELEQGLCHWTADASSCSAGVYHVVVVVNGCTYRASCVMQHE